MSRYTPRSGLFHQDRLHPSAQGCLIGAFVAGANGARGAPDADDLRAPSDGPAWPSSPHLTIGRRRAPLCRRALIAGEGGGNQGRGRRKTRLGLSCCMRSGIS